MTDVDVFGHGGPQEPPAPKEREITYHPTWGGYNNLPRVPGHEWRDYWPRVSTLAKTLDDTSNLTAWKMRQVVRGINDSPVLLDLISDRHTPDSKDGRAQLEFVANRAMELAGSHEGADTGTRLHDLCEQVDGSGMMPSGMTAEEQKIVCSYRARIKASDFEIVPEYMERVLICPELECAGRTDRILRHKPTGKLIIADLKSQKWEPGLYDRQALAIQLAAYANASYMLNMDAWEWEPVPVINKMTGLIIWIPQNQPGRCELFKVNLSFGYQAAVAALEEKQRRKAKGVVTRIA